MSIAAIGTVILTTIPSELTARETLLTPTVGIALSASFLLISFAKLIKSDIFVSLAMSNLKIQGLQAFIRESYPLNKAGSLLLLLNYLLSFSLILHIISGFQQVQLNYELYLIGLVPLALFGWSIGSMFIIGLISGERQVFAEPLAMKVVGTQFLGVVYFVLALILSLHSISEVLFISIVFWAFVVESVIRLYKSVIAVYSRGVSWYYIILYFCTLEILPLFVAYYLLLRDFSL
jgi:hypothetical protein